jgi:hypothetical protein
VAAAVWIGLIYASLYAVRPLAEFLRERNLLRVVVLTVFLLAGAVAVGIAARLRLGIREVSVLAAAAVVYAVVYGRLQIPEERVHLLQYGVLAGLVFGALLLGRRARTSGAQKGLVGEVRAAVAAVFLASGAGWVDELIQGLLPNRHYDLRDVGINALAALLAASTLLAVSAARRSAGGPPRPSAPGSE